ncbi:nucleolar protein 10 [Caerostris extrusa]|uniref:Nucleolar protein 10 n=1 Tax=Caerostris extrusa TaxID=172846 RepID=A0AAV4NUM2_CAEEX|nr:nucleolar protein 10 [Caerostris extrusa]
MNLDQGTFLYPYHTNASSVNKLAIHEYANIIACGTIEGNIEVWDPRQKSRVAIFDIALSVPDYSVVEGFPSVTALSFKGDLTTMAVGTYTGQVMLYDIRATKPFLVKDHDASVQNIEFIENESLIASMDEKYVKFWKQNSGELYTAVSSPDKLNDICIVPNTGLFFLANEEKKILSYFIPSIGPAPKWCCFLDNITEELEESQQDTVYDDYKFVVKSELEQLQLSHLIGTTLLRPYMHGYFMDIRLYKKAIALVQPTAYQEVKKKLINNKVENERNIKQIQVKKLPTVNKEYAKKLLEKKTSDKQQVDTPFEDDRFKDLFENPDFEIKETDEEYARIKATVERNNKKKVTIVPESKLEHLYEEDHQAQSSSSSEEELEDDSDEDSDEDVKPSSKRQRRVVEAVDSDRFNLLKKDEENEELLIPIEERLKNSQTSFKESKSVGGDKIASWTIKDKKGMREEERKAHLKEREKCRRPAKYVKSNYS